MKSTKVVKFISLFFISFIILFGPFLVVDKNKISLLFAAFYNGFSYYSLFLIFDIVIFYLSLYFELFKPKINLFRVFEILTSTFLLLTVSFYPQFFISTYYFECNFSYISVLLMISSVLFILSSLSSIFQDNKLSVKDIVEIGIFVSLAVVLDLGFFKIKIGSQGGSISFAMVPLFLISLRKGFFKGFVASGIIFGLITCLTDNYGFITFPLDYLLGFGSIAIIGLFKNQILPLNNKFTTRGFLFLILGFILSILSRLFFATLSGIIIYKLNFAGSITYQLAYLGPSSALVFAVLILLYKPLLVVNKRYSYHNK